MTTAAVIPDAPARSDPNRFRVLAIVAMAQLMIVLDASVVTIALPSAQRALNISVGDRQWVLTAYTLAFGSLLLLGGRLADYLGRKRVFIVSLLGFAAASALGGLAQNAPMLFAARALQGVLAAAMAPSALSLITLAFTEPRERARAFGVYGAVSGGGAAIGLVVGGLLTQYGSWRWTLLINVPIALVVAAAAWREVRESRAEGEARYDLRGTVTVTAGLLLLVYGFTKAQSDGWGSVVTVSLLGAAVVALALFVQIQRRSPHPLLPLRVVLDRNRGGAFLASLLVGIAMFGTFLLLTYYLQADAPLLGPQERIRVPSLLRRHRPRCHAGQPAAPAPRTEGAHRGRTCAGGSGTGVVHPARGGQRVRRACPSRRDPGERRTGSRLRPDEQHRARRRGRS